MKGTPQPALPLLVLWLVKTSSVATADGQRCCDVDHVLNNNGICIPKESRAQLSASVTSANQSFNPRPLRCPVGSDYLLLGEENGLNVSGGLLSWKDKKVFSKSTDEYCVGVDESGKYVAVICYADIEKVCKKGACIPKCCTEGEAISSKNACVKHENDFCQVNISCPAEGRPAEYVPRCEDFMTYFDPAANAEDKFSVLDDGSLYHILERKSYPPGSYCIDYNIKVSDYQAYYCATGLSEMLRLRNLFQEICLIVSCAFLLLTIQYHTFIKKLRDMQGLCLLCYVLSLFVGDCALLYASYFTREMSILHCIVNGFVKQYGFLTTFMWLNVMCFDIWRVIKATVSLVPLSDILSNDSRKFKAYCAYAFGIPFVIVGVTVALQMLPEGHLPSSSIFRPGMGVTSCWFRGEIARLCFFYGPIAFLSFLNLIFIGHTTIMLFQAGGVFDCSKKDPITSFNRTHLQAFWQRFSLFCLSVVCWVTEVLSWKVPPPEIWIATDIMNSLQGFIVFVIFITCKKKRQVIYRYWKSTMSSVVSRATRSFSRSNDSTASNEKK